MPRSMWTVKYNTQILALFFWKAVVCCSIKRSIKMIHLGWYEETQVVCTKP